MAYFPQRVFSGKQGMKSIDNQGPERLSIDIDITNKMFDPKAKHIDGQQGGIHLENCAFNIGSSDFSKLIGSEPLDGLYDVDKADGSLANTIFAQIKAIWYKIKALGTAAWRNIGLAPGDVPDIQPDLAIHAKTLGDRCVLTNYAKTSDTTPISSSDTANIAIAKLDYRQDLLQAGINIVYTQISDLVDLINAISLNAVDGNAILINFSTLDNVDLVKGVWNKSLARLEC